MAKKGIAGKQASVVVARNILLEELNVILHFLEHGHVGLVINNDFVHDIQWNLIKAGGRKWFAEDKSPCLTQI